VEGLTPARASEQLIQRFGGIRPMANKLEVPFTTVQGWKKRGAIPAARLNDLRAAAQRHGIALEEAELEAVARSDERHPDGPRVTAPARPGPEPSEAPVSEPLAPELSASVGPVPVGEPPVPPPEPDRVPPFEVPVEPAPAPLPAPDPTPDPTPAPIPDPVSVPGSEAILPRSAPAAVTEGVPAVRPQPVSNPDRPVPPPVAAGSPPVVSGAARLSLAGAAIALVAAAVTILWPAPPQSVATAPAAATDHRLSTLEGTLSRLALQQDSQTAAIEKQIGTLDARISLSASQQNADALAARLAILEQSLPALQRQVSSQGLGSPALADLLAATQLRNQLETANPFVTELAAFRLTAFTDPSLKQALDQIANRGKAGIPTQAWLVGRFSVVAANIVRAAAWDHPGQRVTDLLLDLLSDWAPPLYRLTGVPEGSTPRAITERAQAWMATGDFSRAVEQLGELTDKPAETAVAWLAEARARVIADHARELLGKYMLALAEPGTTQP